MSPVGFSLPLSVACHTPLFIIAGGRGGHNSPDIVTSPEMSLDNVAWAIPDNYCLCTGANHHCDKTIIAFEAKFYGWLYETVCGKNALRARLAP